MIQLGLRELRDQPQLLRPPGRVFIWENINWCSSEASNIIKALVLRIAVSPEAERINGSEISQLERQYIGTTRALLKLLWDRVVGYV